MIRTEIEVGRRIGKKLAIGLPKVAKPRRPRGDMRFEDVWGDVQVPGFRLLQTREKRQARHVLLITPLS